MAQYKIGSASVTNGSATVTGVDTLWSAEVSAGDIFTIVGDNAWYEVGSVGSNTSITLTSTYAGSTASGAQYAISRDFTTNKSIPYPQKGDIETASLLKRAMNIIDTELSTGFDSSNVTITGGTINGTTIGGTTAAAVSATTLTTSSTVTLNGGTANGVPYLNGSKVLTTGSALTFDGSVFGVAPATGVVARTKQLVLNNFTGEGVGITFSRTSDDTEVNAIGTANSNWDMGLFARENILFAVGGGSTYSATAEQMRLTSTGLGIGTSSPNYVATLYKASLPVLQIANSTSGSTAADGLLIYLNGANATISNEEAGSIGFQTSGTLRATLDSSGNLGLGVTPNTWSAYKVMQISGVSGVYANGSNEMGMFQNAYYNSGWKYGATGVAAAWAYQYQGAHVWSTAPSGTAGDAISFTQAMSLLASGDLAIGRTSTIGGARISVETVTGTPTYAAYLPTTGTETAFLLVNPNGSVGSITTNGSATTYNTSSDYRLKNITGPITTSGAYIDSLNPVEGTWKADGSTFVGLIAHEVQEASRTQVATGVKDGEEMQGMDYSSAEIIANLIAEVKSLRQRLAAAGI